MDQPEKPRYGATLEEWEHFSLILGLDADLLPVVSNPQAKISPESSIKKAGKIPSRYNNQKQIIGIARWTEKISTLAEVENWQLSRDYGICLQTRLIRALDGDIVNKGLAKKILKVIHEELGIVPVRLRSNSTKFLAAFQLQGDYGKRVLKTGQGNIEFLATGQQFVAAGTHDSGVRYEWAGKLPETFPIISPEQFEKLWMRLTDEFAIEKPSSSKTRKAAVPGDAGKIITDPVVKFLADHNKVLEIGTEGKVFVECPWIAEHSQDNGPTQTTYLCAGTRGYSQGAFRCLHAHCANRTKDDFLTAIGYGADDYEDVSTPEDKKKRERLPVIRADEYINRPPVKWLIKGVIPEQGSGMGYGGSGYGKTFAILDQACAIALGKEWNGCRVQQGEVLYICAEGAGGFMSRIKAYIDSSHCDAKQLGDSLKIMPAAPNFLKKDDVDALIKTIKEKCPNTKMVVVDTMAQTSTGGDENSAKDMGIMLENIERVRDETGCASYLIHHIGKNEALGARGTTALKGDLDFQSLITRNGDRRLFWIDKMKDAPDKFGWYFRLESVFLGNDADGDPITSCVCVWESDKVTEQDLAPKKKRSESEECFLQGWENLGGGRMPYPLVIAEACKLHSHVVDKQGKDNRKNVIRQGMDRLLKSGEIKIDGLDLVNDLEV